MMSITKLEQQSTPQPMLEQGWIHFLQGQARLTDATLQLWTPQGVLLCSAPPDPAASMEPHLLPLVRRCADRGRSFWEGTGGQRPVLAVPVRSRSAVRAVLTARPSALFEPFPGRGGSSASAGCGATTAADGDPSGDRSAQESGPWSDPQGSASTRGSPSFTHAQATLLRASLEAVASAMGSQFDLHLRLERQAEELGSLRTQRGLLRRIAARQTDPAAWRQTLEFILHQGCVAMGAELALLQLPTQRAPLIARHAAPGRTGVPISTKQLRHLAAQLWWSMRSWPDVQIQAPLERLLGQDPVPGLRLQLAAIRLRPERPKAGFLGYLRRGTGAFGPHHQALLHTLAEQVAGTLHKADLHENLSGFLMSTVKALVCAVETKDRYTSGHSARVNLIAMLLGKEMDLPVEAMEALKWASILHDVGKIGMPEAILNKPARLDENEFEVVKQHPWRGYEVVGHIEQLKAASQAVLFHHERLDGLGYPLGISGAAIPIQARIIAVADTFDALTTRRPYREAWGLTDAYAEIRRVSGTQLDAAAVEALGALLPFLREHRVMLETADLVA